MSDVLSRLTAQIEALKDDFDRSFEFPLPTPEQGGVQLLCIRVAGGKAALRLDEVLGLHLSPSLARVPGSPPDLLGLATVRGQLWPAYDLATVLGWGGPGSRHVLCLARGKPPVAFTFEGLDSLRRVRPDEIVRVSARDSSNEALKDGDQVIPLLSLVTLAQRGRGLSLADGMRNVGSLPAMSTELRGEKT